MTASHQEAAPYRWSIAFAGALFLAIAMGSIVNGMAAYVVPMQEAYGWSRSEVSLINFCGIMGMAFGGLVMGRLADGVGTRPVILFGAVTLGACYLAAAATQSLWTLYAIFVIAGFFGTGAIFPPILAAVGNWFPRGAGAAIGIVSAGQALGQGGVPFLSSISIVNLGIPATLAATGAVMLLVLVPLSLLFRAPPAAGEGQGGDGGASGFPPVKLTIPVLCAAILLCCTCMSVPLMHLVPLIQDRGVPAEEAGGVMFVMLVSAIFGRLFFGWLADRIGALPAYMTATFWMTVMVYGFVVIRDLTLLYPYAAVYGFGYAGVMTGILVSIRMLTPPERRGFALGIVTMFGWFGHAAGGYLGGALFDLTGGYALPYGVAAASGVLNLVLVLSFYLFLGAGGGRAVAARRS